MHSVVPTPDLVGQCFLVRRQGIGIGHFEHCRHAAHDSGAGSRFKVFLVVQPRFAEMHLSIHYPRKDMQSRAVDHIAGLRSIEGSDPGNPSISDTDIANALTVLIDDRATFQDQVIGLAHRVSSVGEFVCGVSSNRAYTRALSKGPDPVCVIPPLPRSVKTLISPKRP